MQKPKRSEVWTVDLGSVAKPRPCLVISVPFSDTEYALIAYVPLTTQKRDSRFLIEAPALAKGSPSYFNVQGLGAVDHHAFKQKIGDVDAKTMELIESKIAEWLGMKR